MKMIKNIAFFVFILALLAAGCASSETTDNGTAQTKPADDTAKPADETAKPADETAKPADETAKPADETAKPADETAKPADETAKPAEEEKTFTGTWATDGTGAGGVRTFVQAGASMTGHFDEMRGRYDGKVDGMKLTGRFWWNDDKTSATGFDETPADQRGEFEITLSLDGNAFTGLSRNEGGEWVSWNGIRTEDDAAADEGKDERSYTGTWVTDGTGAGGMRTFVQKDSAVTGHFDEMRGRYDGTVVDGKLTGRFWWNENPVAVETYDDTPAGQRGEFEIMLSLDGNAFTGKSRYDGGEWVSWNGIRTDEPDAGGEGRPSLDFTGTWATDGTGAGGVRVFAQSGTEMTGNFDEMRGRYNGTVEGRKLAGRFWWNEDPEAATSFEDTPAGQKGEFEITLSLDGNAFTGKSRFEGGEWDSWNGIRIPDEKQDEGEETDEEGEGEGGKDEGGKEEGEKGGDGSAG